MSRKHPDPDTYETERWTLNRNSKLFPGWTERIVYSVTDRGVYSQLTLYNKDGKEMRYSWANASINVESLEERGFKYMKRRKPKRLILK